MIQLFDNPLSPYARKVRLALYEKGLDFTKHEILRESQRAELLEVSPRGEVPALVDGENTIADSAIIVAYLEDRYPQIPLLPSDPVERARCRRLEKISDTDVDVAGILVFLLKFARPDVVDAFPPLAGEVTAMVEGVYSFLERELSGRDFLAGDGFTIAEAAMLPHVTAMVFAGYPVGDARGNLTGWLERMNERPSLQKDLSDAVVALEELPRLEDPMFDNNHLHWRDSRIEGLHKVGLGRWLIDELAAGRAFLPPLLGAL